ncbi:MAG: hypothetical protein KDC85_22120, partial [Saprospiraceae bacterium]|nr:hypothetical protein [Saprospiraceae bacterium]
SIENKSIALQHDLPISGYKRLQTTVNGYHTTNYAQPPIFVKSVYLTKTEMQNFDDLLLEYDL